jgi:hypothetical protein
MTFVVRSFNFKVIATLVARAGNDKLPAWEGRPGSHQWDPYGHGGANSHQFLGYHIKHSLSRAFGSRNVSIRSGTGTPSLCSGQALPV